MTVGMALDRYEQHLKTEGNRGWALKPGSIITEMTRLRNMLADPDQPLENVKRAQLQSAYLSRVAKNRAADTHRNELSATKTFFGWCIETGMVRNNPCDGIKPQGRRKHGIESKAQLRMLEAQKLRAYAIAQTKIKKPARADGMLATAILLDTGLRSGELLNLRVRDIDQRGEFCVLCVDRGKSRAAQRTIHIPNDIAQLLQDRCKGKPGDAWLWPARKKAKEGHRTQTWIRRTVARLCKEAGVPVVCPHGLRGTFATMARQSGMSLRDLYPIMGHESPSTSEQSYITPEATEDANRRSALRVLQGGMS